jgi:hypothetical protein
MDREPWQIYFDEFARRAGPITGQHFDRDSALAEAAHDAYRITADTLSRTDGWSDDRTLLVTHAFGQTVKEWIAAAEHDLDALKERLRERWTTL